MDPQKYPEAMTAILLNGEPEKAEMARWAFMELSSVIAFQPHPRTKFSMRVEGNSLTALCFRNGPLEDAHTENRLEDERMKEINIWSSRALSSALAMRDLCDRTPIGKEYWKLVVCAYHEIFCHSWETSAIPPEENKEPL